MLPTHTLTPRTHRLTVPARPGAQLQLRGRGCWFTSHGTTIPSRDIGQEPRCRLSEHGHAHGRARRAARRRPHSASWTNTLVHGHRPSSAFPASQPRGTSRATGLSRPPSTHSHGRLSHQTSQTGTPRQQHAFLSELCVRTDAHLHRGHSSSAPRRTAPITPPMPGMCTPNTHHSLWSQVCN